MSPCTYFLFVFGEALELAYILLFGITIYLTLSCIKILDKEKKNVATTTKAYICSHGKHARCMVYSNYTPGVTYLIWYGVHASTQGVIIAVSVNSHVLQALLQ